MYLVYQESLATDFPVPGGRVESNQALTKQNCSSRASDHPTVYHQFVLPVRHLRKLMPPFCTRQPWRAPIISQTANPQPINRLTLTGLVGRFCHQVWWLLLPYVFSPHLIFSYLSRYSIYAQGYMTRNRHGNILTRFQYALSVHCSVRYSQQHQLRYMTNIYNTKITIHIDKGK